MADLVGRTPKEKRQNTPGMHSIEGNLKISLGRAENDEVTRRELADVKEGVRGNRTLGIAERRVTARSSRLKRRGERIFCKTRVDPG